jgi:DNA-binding response OmpR family regulator
VTSLRVLLVDDDPTTRDAADVAIRREGFEVRSATTSVEALAIAARWPPDVAIVGSRLSDGFGMDVMSALRLRDAAVHVMLTGSGDEQERIRALHHGADQYVSSPCSGRELAARVVSIDRRRRAMSTRVLDLGPLVIHIDAREVVLDGRPVAVPPRELDLLIHLATHPRQTFTREQLLRAVWSSTGEWQDTATVTEHIRRLRMRIEQHPLNPRWLVTIRGVGYRFEPGFADRLIA